MNDITTDELIERMAKAMRQMSGNELADLYNREFGNGMVCRGDDQFAQFDTQQQAAT